MSCSAQKMSQDSYVRCRAFVVIVHSMLYVVCTFDNLQQLPAQCPCMRKHVTTALSCLALGLLHLQIPVGQVWTAYTQNGHASLSAANYMK